MLWYLIKTWAGGEEKLVKEIRRTVPPYMYQDAFVIYNERIWRRQGQSIIRLEPLFKGCVFLTCQKTEPLFRRFDRIPAMSRLIATGYLSIFPLMEQDANFLESISGGDHVIRTSYMLREDEGSSTYLVSGPLEYLIDGIEGIRFRTRTVKTHKKLWGEDKEIVLGIIANEDLGRKPVYEGPVAIEKLPDHYTVLEIGTDSDGNKQYLEGPQVYADRDPIEALSREKNRELCDLVS